MDTTESMDDENHREALRQQIPIVALELFKLEEVPGLSFRLDNTRSVYIGIAPGDDYRSRYDVGEHRR